MADRLAVQAGCSCLDQVHRRKTYVTPPSQGQISTDQHHDRCSPLPEREAGIASGHTRGLNPSCYGSPRPTYGTASGHRCGPPPPPLFHGISAVHSPRSSTDLPQISATSCAAFPNTGHSPRADASPTPAPQFNMCTPSGTWLEARPNTMPANSFCAQHTTPLLGGKF